MGEEIKAAGYHPADINGDGVVSNNEQLMYIEFKRKELEDEDAQRDAKRKMSWFALSSGLAFPFFIILAAVLKLDNAVTSLSGIAPVYFVSAFGLVGVFFGADAYAKAKGN